MLLDKASYCNNYQCCQMNVTLCTLHRHVKHPRLILCIELGAILTALRGYQCTKFTLTIFILASLTDKLYFSYNFIYRQTCRHADIEILSALYTIINKMQFYLQADMQTLKYCLRYITIIN